MQRDRCNIYLNGKRSEWRDSYFKIRLIKFNVDFLFIEQVQYEASACDRLLKGGKLPPFYILCSLKWVVFTIATEFTPGII
jgi:hypothetical protein